MLTNARPTPARSNASASTFLKAPRPPQPPGQSPPVRRDSYSLRAVEHAYRVAVEYDTPLSPPDESRTIRYSQHLSDREIELE